METPTVYPDDLHPNRVEVEVEGVSFSLIRKSPPGLLEEVRQIGRTIWSSDTGKYVSRQAYRAMLLAAYEYFESTRPEGDRRSTVGGDADRVIGWCKKHLGVSYPTLDNVIEWLKGTNRFSMTRAHAIYCAVLRKNSRKATATKAAQRNANRPAKRPVTIQLKLPL